MSGLPLSKTLDPADYRLLEPELKVVNQYWDTTQHEHRRWEYAMALRAISVWQQSHHGLIHAVDVGGGGSPLSKMLNSVLGVSVEVVDPTVNLTLAEHLHSGARLADVVTCVSVLEHVEDLSGFLYHLSCLVAPGGLLFLTMDCWNGRGEDTAHFHWDRKRIFSMKAWRSVSGNAVQAGFDYLGDTDWLYHGDQLYGSYSFASLALVKRA